MAVSGRVSLFSTATSVTGSAGYNIFSSGGTSETQYRRIRHINTGAAVPLETVTLTYSSPIDLSDSVIHYWAISGSRAMDIYLEFTDSSGNKAEFFLAQNRGVNSDNKIFDLEGTTFSSTGTLIRSSISQIQFKTRQVTTASTDTITLGLIQVNYLSLLNTTSNANFNELPTELQADDPVNNLILATNINNIALISYPVELIASSNYDLSGLSGIVFTSNLSPGVSTVGVSIDLRDTFRRIKFSQALPITFSARFFDNCSLINATTAQVTFSSVTFVNIKTSNLGNFIFRNSSFLSSQTLSGGTSFESCVFSLTPYEWNGTATFENTIFTGNTAHYINFDGANFADGTTIDLSTVTFGTPGTKLFRLNATGKTLNILVAAGSGITASDVTVVAGSVNVTEPVNEIVITGIPNVVNAILAVVNLTTSAITFPTLSGGGATVPLDAGTNYLFVADAPGYLAQRVTLGGTTPAFEFTLTDYRAIYESGTNRSVDIAFDYDTFEVLIEDGTPNLPFADVFRTIEDYLSTENGVLFPNPPYPVVIATATSARNYLFFPYDEENDQVNPVVIRPDPTNTTDPTLTDFVIVLEGSEAPLFDIFDFTLAGGRTIRFQTDAVAAIVNTTGGVEAPTEAEIYAYFAEGIRPNVFKADVAGLATTSALANLTTTVGVAGAGLTAIPWNVTLTSGIQTALGLSGAFLENYLNYIIDKSDEIVSSTNTIKGSGFDESTDSLEAIRNRGDSAWATATGFLTSANIPTNFENLIINEDGEVISSNMRGTDGALTTLGTNAPINWINAQAIDISALNSIKDGLAITADLTPIQANIGLLLDINKLTINKSVVYTSEAITVGNDEIIIELSNDTNNVVTATRII